MARARNIATVAAVLCAATVLGAGVAQAAPHRATSPGSYQSWGPSWVYDDGWSAGAGRGQFGERADATAVGGTQYVIDFLPSNGRPTYIYATYYFYGPGPTSTTCSGGGSCWYVNDGDRFDDWSSNTWHSQYGSTPLVGNADRARAYYKACENIRLHSDPCSTTAILTTSY